MFHVGNFIKPKQDTVFVYSPAIHNECCILSINPFYEKNPNPQFKYIDDCFAFVLFYNGIEYDVGIVPLIDFVSFGCNTAIIGSLSFDDINNILHLRYDRIPDGIMYPDGVYETSIIRSCSVPDLFQTAENIKTINQGSLPKENLRAGIEQYIRDQTRWPKKFVVYYGDKLSDFELIQKDSDYLDYKKLFRDECDDSHDGLPF